MCPIAGPGGGCHGNGPLRRALPGPARSRGAAAPGLPSLRVAEASAAAVGWSCSRLRERSRGDLTPQGIAGGRASVLWRATRGPFAPALIRNPPARVCVCRACLGEKSFPNGPCHVSPHSHRAASVPSSPTRGWRGAAAVIERTIPRRGDPAIATGEISGIILMSLEGKGN